MTYSKTVEQSMILVQQISLVIVYILIFFRIQNSESYSHLLSPILIYATVAYAYWVKATRNNSKIKNII